MTLALAMAMALVLIVLALLTSLMQNGVFVYCTIVVSVLLFCILVVLLYLCDFASADCFNLAFVLQDFNKRILLEPLLRFDTSAAVGGRFDVGLWD